MTNQLTIKKLIKHLSKFPESMIVSTTLYEDSEPILLDESFLKAIKKEQIFEVEVTTELGLFDPPQKKKSTEIVTEEQYNYFYRSQKDTKLLRKIKTVALP